MFAKPANGENDQSVEGQQPSLSMANYQVLKDIFALKNEIRDLKAAFGYRTEISRMNETIQLLEDKILILEEKVEDKADARVPSGTGATYVRWGRTVCPSVYGTVKIYDGFAAGDHYTHGGGGVELLCLPKDPTWGKYSATTVGHAYLYGTEYELKGANKDALFGKHVHDNNVPCVVCQSVGRFATLRIPGRTNCYSGWTKEYFGYLMAGYHGHAKSTDYTCVDSYPKSITGKSADQDGHLLYPVEANCYKGSLPCPPYETGKEIACVVCTK